MDWTEDRTGGCTAIWTGGWLVGTITGASVTGTLYTGLRKKSGGGGA